MRLKLIDLIITDLSSRAARAARRVSICAVAVFAVTACNHSGNEAVDAGTLGLSLTPVSGNNQSARPSFVFTNPLILQALDAQAQLPMSFVTVDFTVTTPGSDAVILIPEVVSDSTGMVQTKVRAPSSYNQTITVEARIRGTEIVADYQLNTNQLGTATQYIADTTHNDSEIAGVPFGFIIRVADTNGATVPTFDGPLTMVIRFDTQSSWTGVAPTLPPTNYTCNFVAGVCTTPAIYILTDARQPTKMYVGDSANSLQAEFYKPIQVAPNVRDHLAVANIIGGPNAGSVPYPTTGIFLNADQGLGGALKTFSAAVVDVVGNYLGDPDQVLWTATGMQPTLTPTWDVQNSLTTSGITGSINPKVVGSATLTVNYTGTQGAVSPGTDQLVVDPGPNRALWHLVALTGAMDPKTLLATQRAGESFPVVLSAVDSQGNSLSGSSTNNYADEFTGNFSIKLNYANDRGPNPNSTCTNLIQAVFGGTDLSYYTNPNPPMGTPIANAVCSGVSANESELLTVSFVKGLQNQTTQQIRGILNWASALNGLNNIRMTADMQTAQFGFPALNNGAGSGPITVSLGSPAAVNFWTGQNGPGGGSKPLCQRIAREIALPPAAPLGGQGSAGTYNCPALTLATSGDAPTTYYPVVEDRGGNWIADAASGFAIANRPGEWTVNGGGTSATCAPIVAGTDTVAATTNSSFNIVQDAGNTVTQPITTAFAEVVAPLPLDHFVLAANDVGSLPLVPPLPTDTITTIYPYTLKVYAYDRNNNFLSTFAGTYNLTFNIVGAGASPLGTAAVLPKNTTYTFAGGVASVVNNSGTANLRQALNQNITIQMSAAAGPSAIDLSVQVLPGPMATVGIRDSANGGGTSLTAPPSAITMTDLQSKTFFAAGYDTELNYLNPGSFSWTGSGTLAATTSPAFLPTAQSFINYSPTLLGSGVLTFTSSGLTASTGLITVTPSAPDHIAVTAVGGASPTAGQSIQVGVQIQDVRSNPYSYTGNLTLGIQVNEAPTLDSFAYTSSYAPQTSGPQAYGFTAGVLNTNQAFTLYNSGVQGYITYSVTAGPANIVALSPGTLTVTPTPSSAYQVYVQKPAASMAAGATSTYFGFMVDQYGNTITTYPTSSATVSLIAPSADQKITQLNGTVTNAQSVVGTMTNGVVTFNVTGTATGTISPTVTVTGGPANAPHLDPITVANGAATQLVWTAQPSTSYSAGTGLGVGLTLKDSYNNVVTTGSDASATVTLALYQSGAAQPGKQVGSWSMNASGGVANFAGGTVLARPYLTTTGSSFTVRGTASSVSPTSVGDSSSFNVVPAADSQLVFATQPAAGTCTANGTTLAGQCAGVAFSTQPVLTVEDQYGNTSTATGAGVYLTPYTSSNCAAGTVGNTALMMPSSNPTASTVSGTATFTGVGYQVADSTSGGSVYLQATSGALPAICSNGVLVKPAQATAPTYVASTGLTTSVAGTTYSSAAQMPQFKIVDNYGNGVPNYTVNFAWQNPTPTYPYGQSVTASATTNTSGIAQPSTFTVQNVTGLPSTVHGCFAGYNYIIASTSPNIGTASSPQIFTTPSTATKVAFTSQPQAGGSNQGQTLNTAIQTQPVSQLQDQYSNCAYSVANGSDTFTASLYTDSACSTSAGATLASNTSSISSGQGNFSGLLASAVTSTGTAYYMQVIDSSNGFTACSTNTVKFYNAITPIYFNTVGTTSITTPASGATVMLIVQNGVPSSYTFGFSSKGSSSTNCSSVPTMSGSFTGGSCPSTYTCATYTPGCWGNNSTDTVFAKDGSGSSSANNKVSANVTVSGAALQWQTSTPTSWGAFSSATTETYTLTNAGTAAAGSNLSVNFSADSHFSINSDNCSSVALSNGATCTVTIKFDPTAAPALGHGVDKTGSIYYTATPGGQTSTINFDASAQ